MFDLHGRQMVDLLTSFCAYGVSLLGFGQLELMLLTRGEVSATVHACCLAAACAVAIF
jgi:hypothetical protein